VSRRFSLPPRRPNPIAFEEGQEIELASGLDVRIFQEMPHYWAHRELQRLYGAAIALAQYGWMIKASEWEPVTGTIGASRQALERLKVMYLDRSWISVGLVLAELPVEAGVTRQVMTSVSTEDWVVYRKQHRLLELTAQVIQNAPLCLDRLRQVGASSPSGSLKNKDAYALLHERAQAELGHKLARYFVAPSEVSTEPLTPLPVLVPQRGEPFDFEKAGRELAWGYGVLAGSTSEWRLAHLQSFAANYDGKRATDWVWVGYLVHLREAAMNERAQREKGRAKSKGLAVAKIVERATEVIFAAWPAVERAHLWSIRQAKLARDMWPSSYALSLQKAVRHVRAKAQEPALPEDWLTTEWQAGIDEVHAELRRAGVR